MRPFFLMLLMGLGLCWGALAQAGGSLLPANCLKDKVYPCAIYAYSKTFFTHAESQYYVSADTLLELRSDSEMVLHKGILWSQQKHGVHLQTIFGAVHLSAASEGLIDVGVQQITVSSTKGTLTVQPRGEKEDVSLIAGTQIYLWPMDYQEHSSAVSFPRVLELKTYVKTVSKVFPFTEINFQKHIESVAQKTVLASQQQALWNKTIVERKIAHVQEQERRRRYVSEYEKERAEYLRKRFRQKNNFEE